jgi:hypothetical protein
MRAIVWVALAGLAGCFPIAGDDDCTGQAPELHVGSTDMAAYEYADSVSDPPGPYATAVGGTQRFKGELVNDCANLGSADITVVNNANLQTATVTVNNGMFDVVGVAPGTAMLDVVGNNLRAEASMKVAGISRVALAAKELGEPAAYIVGAPVATILLLDDVGDPLVDRNLSVTGDIALGDKWNDLATATAGAGDHPLVLHAGGADWPVTLTVVDHIDDIAPDHPTITLPADPTAVAQVCFYAHENGMVIAGVPWQLDFDTQAAQLWRANCVEVHLGNDHKLVQTVTAHALGFTATATVTFMP